MTPPILAVLHPADLYRNPQLRLPSLMDWSKIARFLKGEWPAEIPPRIIVEGDDFDAVQDAVDWISEASEEVSCDTEYIPQTRYMTLIGFASRGPHGQVTGVQIAWPRVHWTHKQVLGRAIRDMVGRCTTIFQNTMADVPVIEKAIGITYADYHAIEDTLLGHAVLWSEMDHDLEFLASLYSPYPKQKHLSKVDQISYHWGDICDTLTVWEALKSEFAKDPLSEGIYRSQSLPLIPIILESNAKGIRVDAGRVQTASAEYHEKMSTAQTIAQAYVGWPINVGSNAQLKFWLYDIEGMPIQKNKDTKKETVDGDAIAALRALYEPLPDLDDEAENGVTVENTLTRVEEGAHPLLESRVLYAGALQAESHYIRPALAAVTEGDGRIYPQTKIHAQASGRHSITDPPMQQIPPDLRDIILPDEGEEWLKWDWSAIESRLLAVLADDKKLIDLLGVSFESRCQNIQRQLWGETEESRRAFVEDLFGVWQSVRGSAFVDQAREVLQSLLLLHETGICAGLRRWAQQIPATVREWEECLRAPTGNERWPGRGCTSHQWERTRQSAGELGEDVAPGAWAAAYAAWIVCGGPHPQWQGEKDLARYKGDVDIHTVNYCDIFSKPYPPLLTKALHTDPSCAAWRASLAWQGDDDVRRRFTKTAVYRIHYRGYPDGSIAGASRLGLDKKRFAEIHRNYLAVHPWIVEYWRKRDMEAADSGATRTFMGRRRQSLIWQRGRPLPESVKRELSNQPLQGGVADILNATIIAVKKACPQARLVYSAHDAATFGYPIHLSDEYVPRIKEIVQRPFQINGRQVSFPTEFRTRRAA